ncbi:acetyl-CoA carboxylase carboxyl transferase subunit alpha [Nocardiopsis potens]|uniref:acetyl-CoA carboxylase carboxyl transferase subunit alpha n=1 Tax=Nocardiopsis potens TaxID=1246458 RepID=UPI000347E357|nr:acetyl-CoA carboxylase carboxyl transferase subunit alpha [Nocardiopsis potens]
MTATDERASGAAAGGGFIACGSCRMLVYGKRHRRLLGVCPECGAPSRLGAGERLDALLDPGSAVPVPVGAAAVDPLGFTDTRPYPERLARARADTGLDDAVAVVRGTVQGHPLVVAVMDFRFLGGSLGSAAGEAVTAAAEAALADHTPLLVVTASGGARMQEGALALMQMAKTSAAMADLDEAGLLTITLVTDPTYGGVSASFATLSDVILAEPGARMGFAGARVIRQTINQELPEGFQTAEFLLRHGLVDGVCERGALRGAVGRLLAAASSPPGEEPAGPDPVVRSPERLPERSPDEAVRLARHIDRPTGLDHIGLWAEGFVELHGDRAGEDCPAVVGGPATVAGTPVMLIAHQKGHTTTELVRRNFGMPSPAGYRKARRLMLLAAKLGLPVVTLIDTPGAYPGVSAEEQGQSNAIAECLRTMASLPVPIVSVVTGEGGSGGALALGMGNTVLMCENAIYSVISPEGCAAILWKGPDGASKAASALRLSARPLLELGVVDGVVPEPEGGAHTDPSAASTAVRDAVAAALADLESCADPRAGRRRRFRAFGQAAPVSDRSVEEEVL